ncbi:MAG: SprT family zinc-dependent metalloprotease [Candidatus Limivivens sp.]|nr:SprT family zinc-dependent metalloprotease [Candidatus Limivivens sp.]
MELDFVLERKSVKNLYLRVSPDGTVKVTAPQGMSLRRIRQVLEEKQDWILAQQQKYRAARQVWETSDLPVLDRDSLRLRLSERIPFYLAKWEPVMGVHAAQWRIRDMKTRWGSCNVRDRRIWISQALGAYPEECLEYVIVHELCHLLEPSHNAVFKGYMSRFLPDWQNRRSLLNTLSAGQKGAS